LALKISKYSIADKYIFATLISIFSGNNSKALKKSSRIISLMATVALLPANSRKLKQKRGWEDWRYKQFTQRWKAFNFYGKMTEVAKLAALSVSRPIF
jgi:hypothetical protein